MIDDRLRDGTRQVAAWLHGWIGLILGWLLFAMCLAGTLSVFRPEVGRWARPETDAVVAPSLATARAVAWLGKHASAAPAWFLLSPTDRTNTVEATWFDGKDFVRRAFDPLTGAPVPRDTLGGEFFYRLHFELQMPYPYGRLLASLAAMAMLIAIVTGVIAHARIFRDFFTFRPARGQRSWLDAHNALGVLSLPFHAMITLTGLVTLATVSMPWGIVANYGADTQRMFAAFTPDTVERPATARRLPLTPIAPLLHDAERRLGGAPLGYVTIQNPGDAAATITVTRADRGSIARVTDQLVFDGTTGRLLTDWREHGRPAVATYNTLYGLHVVHFAGTLVRWLYAVGGAMLTFCIATGLVLWVNKRRARAPLSRAEQIVERLNIGVIAGTLIAFEAFFLANRLIPADAPLRATTEVAAVFWTWGLAVGAGLLLPPRRGWTLLLSLASAGAIAIPLAGMLDPAAALWTTLARGDFAIAGVDITALATGIALAHAARTASRSPAPRPARPRLAEPALAR